MAVLSLEAALLDAERTLFLNLEAGELAVQGWPGDEVRIRDWERARDLAGQVGIADKLSRHPDHLSQGERQRVAVCRALATEPVLLLAEASGRSGSPLATASERPPAPNASHRVRGAMNRMRRALRVTGMAVVQLMGHGQTAFIRRLHTHCLGDAGPSQHFCGQKGGFGILTDVALSAQHHHILGGMITERTVEEESGVPIIADGGMLFVFPRAGYRSFWMLDCLIDIDRPEERRTREGFALPDNTK